MPTDDEIHEIVKANAKRAWDRVMDAQGPVRVPGVEELAEAARTAYERSRAEAPRDATSLEVERAAWEAAVIAVVQAL